MLLDIDADPLYKSAAFQRIVSCQADLPRSVSENFSLFCEICLKRNEVCATFRNHDQTIPHLPS